LGRLQQLALQRENKKEMLLAAQVMVNLGQVVQMLEKKEQVNK
jgi:hypothetical protein